MRNKRSKSRPYRVSKLSMKDHNIDSQITAIHLAIAQKLLLEFKQGNDELYRQVSDNLESKYDQGQIGYGVYITWTSVLELLEQPQAFIDAMTENSAKMKRLRRQTPFVNILSEEERQQALYNNAAGVLNHVEIY